MQRHSRLLIAGAAALAAVFVSGLVAFANAPLTLVRVSTDPYTSSGFSHQTEVEPGR